MSLIADTLLQYLPGKRKHTPSGWISFNAPCCDDKRQRGGFIINGGDAVSYHCFNCGFKASWQPGRPLTEKFKSLCRWLGAGEDTINAMIFEALKTEAPEYVHEVTEAKAKFTEKELPPDARPINEWVNSNDLESVAEQLEPVISYLVGRGFDPMSNRFNHRIHGGVISAVLDAMGSLAVMAALAHPNPESSDGPSLL
jgi:hypothetical protein